MIIILFSKETNKEKKKTVTDSSVTVDLTKLSRTKKLQLLKRESPEFMPLVEDFKGKAAKAHPASYKELLCLYGSVSPFTSKSTLLNIVKIFKPSLHTFLNTVQLYTLSVAALTHYCFCNVVLY